MPRVKACKQCEQDFEPVRPLQAVCSPHCALERSKDTQRKAAERAQKLRDARTRERLKTRSEWLREAQKAFNRYIRARDYGKPCISSGRYHSERSRYGGLVDAGHYRSVGAAGHLRFHLLNCWAQSKQDNRDLSGNTVEYRKGLIARIGIDRVEKLENDNNSRKFDIDYLKRVKRIFNKRARYYEKRRGL